MLQQTRRLLVRKGIFGKFQQSFRELNTHKTLLFIDRVSKIHQFQPSSSNTYAFIKTQKINNARNWCLQRPFSSKPSQKNSNKQNNRPQDKHTALICRVINQTGWSDETETHLDSLNIKLSSDIVLSVLENFVKHPEIALNFFNWAATQTYFSHTSSTYNAVIRIVGHGTYIDQFWSIIEQMSTEGYQMDVKTYVKVLRRLLKSGMMEDAVYLFVLMMRNTKEKPSSQNCSTILLHLASAWSPNIDLVYRVIETFRKGKGEFNKAVYDGIHRCLTNAGRFEEAEGVVKAMEKAGFVPDNITYSQLVFGLSKVGRLDEAFNVLDGMEGLGCDPDVKTWTILIEGYCKAGEVDRAVSCFDLMLESGCKADGEVLEVLVYAFCKQDRIEDAHSFLCKMIEEKGFKPWQATFKELLQKLAGKEKLAEALKLVGLMKNQGFPPFADPFHELFAKSGSVDKALQFLNKLRKKQSPSARTYFSMLDAFCKAGKQAEARELLNKCPVHIRKNPDVLSLFGSTGAPSPA